jgi:hypothetical protein
MWNKQKLLYRRQDDLLAASMLSLREQTEK